LVSTEVLVAYLIQTPDLLQIEFLLVGVEIECHLGATVKGTNSKAAKKWMVLSSKMVEPIQSWTFNMIELAKHGIKPTKLAENSSKLTNGCI
jgi:hypothetical protein